MLALPLCFSSQPANANTVVQTLGACNGAQAQFLGNTHKGRSQLTSFGPDSYAGFFLSGISGTTIKNFKFLLATFETPADASTYEVTLRVVVQGLPNRVQNFSVGADSNPLLPNLPTDQSGTRQVADFNGGNLVGGKSSLSENDVIEKVSFIFNSTEKVTGRATKCLIVDTSYDDKVLPLSLETPRCNLK